MDRTADAALGGMRLAFWGYTNGYGADAAPKLARQLRRCEVALDGRAAITRFFYETPERVSDLMVLAVRGAGGPSHHDGVWDDLAAVLPAAGRGFDAIICERIDRLGRICSRVLAREQLAADHGVAILSADQLILGLAETCKQVSTRMRQRFLTSLRDYDYAAAESIIRGTRRCAGG